MENMIKIFENKEFGTFRVLEIDGQPWFIGKEVAEILDYGNYRQALKTNVEAEDKGVHSMDTLGGKQKIVVINESGLYSLILSSKLPTAKKFKRWVTSDILPSVKKYGSYITNEMLEQLLADPDFTAKYLTMLKAERDEKEALEKRVRLLEPKADYHDVVLKCGRPIPVTIIAKDYGMTACVFNRILKAAGIQYRVANTWVLKKQYLNKGYTISQTYEDGDGNPLSIHTCWTQKGRRFIYDTLKDKGIFPQTTWR